MSSSNGAHLKFVPIRFYPRIGQGALQPECDQEAEP